MSTQFWKLESERMTNTKKKKLNLNLKGRCQPVGRRERPDGGGTRYC